jgi:hypothetical protein
VYGVKLAGGTGDAIHGDAFGAGAAVSGTSSAGRGGVFQGAAAAVRLVPSSATTHPSAGQAGDLFLDASVRLWLCKTTGSAAKWVLLG